MTIKFVKKPTLSLEHISLDMKSYLDNQIHISKILNKLSKNDIPVVITYLKSLLKFNSLTMTKNKLSDKDSYTQLIRPAQYLLLCLSFIETKSIELKINNSLLNKISNKFSFNFSTLNTVCVENLEFDYPDFINFEYLLPSDSLNVKIYDNKKTMKRYVVPFLNLSFYLKNDVIQFFNNEVITEDFVSQSNLDNIYNKYKHSYKKYY